MTRFVSRIAVRCLLLLVSGLLLISPLSAKEPDKPRIKLVMASAERVLSDLEWIVAKLAREPGQWENSLFPSLDIFLLGVDRNKPIRFDVLIGGEDPGAVNPGSYRFQPCIPVDRDGKDLRTFIRENLEPIGIVVKQRSRGGFYSLEDAYVGWMRMVDEYACIGMYETDVPKGMPNPEESQKEILKHGYDIALEIDNTADQTEERTKAIAGFEANILDATKPKEGESADAFALRKGTLTHTIETFGRLFEEARQVTVGWITDIDKQTGRAELYGEGLPGTDLEKLIESISVEHSMFAALPMPEDPAASLRVNLPYNDMRKKQLKENYELWRPVIHDKIQSAKNITSAEKEPAEQAVDLVLDMMTAGIEVGRLDLYVDMTKTEAGPHVFVAGIRSADGKKADDVVKLIPQAHSAWSVEMDVEAVGGTAIHKVNLSKDLPTSIKEMFGDSGALYVGTSADLVWIAGGEGSLDQLKEKITRVNDAKVPADVSPVFGEFKVHAHTLLKLYDSLVVEMNWNPVGKIEVKPKDDGKTRIVGDGTGLQPIDPAEIRDIATRATAEIDDRVSGTAKRIDKHAEGEVVVGPGVLRAVGKIVAKISADNL